MPVPIEYEDLTDKAVMWVFTKATAKGDPRVGNPVEVPVRWEEGNSEIADPEGNRINVDVILACDRQLKVGSLMWEGSQALLATTFPNSIPTKDLYEVVVRNRAKDTKGMFTRFEFGLRRYKDKLPGITLPPTVVVIVSRSPTIDAEDVSINTTVTVTFNTTIDPTNLFVTLIDTTTLVAGVVTYSGVTAIFTPSVALAVATEYLVRVGGVVPATSWSFTTAGSQSFTLFTDVSTPANSNNEAVPLTLGCKFKSSVAGTISAIRYWRDAQASHNAKGKIYDVSGTLLVSKMFSVETASGWQQVSLDTPLSIAANTTYIVSFFTQDGTYGSTGGYFVIDHVSGPLTALSSGGSGGNGVFIGGDLFPTNTFNASNYWVDVVFTPS